MKKLLPKRKPERKPSEEEFALRKSTAALEEDDQILKVIKAYCTSAKTRQTLNSSSRKESAPQVLLPEEEKIIIEETKSNGQTVIEKKSLIDTVYALKDEVQELRQDNKKDEEVSGGGAESPQRPGEAGEEGSEEHERPCLERDQPPKLPGSVSKTGQDTSPCDVQYCMAGLDDSCLPVHREAGGSQARRMHPGDELCQPSSVSISVTLFGNKGSDQPQALAFQVFTEYI